MIRWNIVTIAALICGVAVGSQAGCSSGGDGNDRGDSGWAGSDGGGDDANITDGSNKDAKDGGTGGSHIIEVDATVDVDYRPDGFEGDAACAGEVTEAKFSPANMLFLIDRTGSMKCNPPPTTDSKVCEKNPVQTNPSEPSKWQITSAALLEAWTTLKGGVFVPSVGMSLFNNDDYCGYPNTPDVDVLPLNDTHYATLKSAIDAVKPRGSTPIIQTTLSALKYFYDNLPKFEGNRFVVLLTDGTETCEQNQQDGKAVLLEAAEKMAKGAKTRTFVLGVPGSEGERAFLSRIAYAGQTASSDSCDHTSSDPSVGNCHMDMTKSGTDFAKLLSENLAKISAQAMACDFDVPETSEDGTKVDYGKVNVRYFTKDDDQGEVVKFDEGKCANPDSEGWMYVEGSKKGTKKIVLCEATCKKIRNDPYANISIELGCETEKVIY